MFKKIYFSILTLTALLCFGTPNAWGETIDVSVGTNTNGNVPFNTSWADTQGTKSQFIYPKDQIETLQGTNITALRFYANSNLTFGSGSKAGTAPKIAVRMKEVDATTLSAFVASNTLTEVYNARPDKDSKELYLEFATPFAYSDKNLLVEVEVVEGGGYCTSSWYGVSLSSGTSYYHYNTSTDAAYLLPKTTFTYEEAAAVSGSVLSVYDGSSKLTSGYNYNFGLAIEGTTKIFTLKNPGTEATPVAVAHSGSFDASLSAASIPADGEVTLTVTMPATSSSDVITILSSAEGVDDFTINVSGTVKDPSKVFETLLGGSIPADWTTSGGTWSWSTTNGASNTAWYESSNYRLITPQLTVAAGEVFYFDAQGTYSGYQGVKFEYSVDGSTWTASSTATTVSASWQTFMINDIPVGKYYIALHGWHANIRNFYGGFIPSVPKDITLESAATNSLTLSWTPAGSETAWVMQYSTDGTSWSGDVAANSNPFTLTGLNASTKYYVRVKAAGSSDWSQVANFSTECGAITSSTWTENFGSATADEVPPCWSVIVTEAEYPIIKASTNSSHYHTASPGLLINNKHLKYGIAVFPEIANLNTLQISFWHKEESSSSSNCGNLELGYLTNAADSTTFHLIKKCDLVASWAQVTDISLSSVPAGARLAFRYIGKNTSWEYYTAIDDIAFSELPSCPKPTGLGSSDVTASSAIIAWTSDASAWKLQTSADGSNWTDVAGEITNPYVLSGLNENTKYYVRVCANCGGNGDSDWTEAINFTTECAAKALPFIEGFEGDALPACWSAASQWAIYSYSGAGHNSNVAMRYTSSSTADLALPAIALDDKAQFSFWRQSSYVSCSVYINDGTGEAKLGDFAKNSSWKKDSVDLSGYKGKTVTLIIRGNYYSGSKYLYIDDIAVTYKPVVVPTNLSVEPGNGNAVVTWESVEDGATFNLQYRTNGEGEWTAVNNINAKTYTIESLTNGTEYEVQVKAVASANRQSAWTVSTNFTPQACPTVQGAVLSAKTYNSVTVGCTLSGAGVWDLQYKAGEGEWLSAGTEIAEATKVVTPLEVGTLYSFQVKPSCGSDWTPVAETYTPAYAAPASATASASSDIAASASWSAVVDASGYEYLVLASGEPDWSSATSTSETSVASLGTLVGGTNYTFYVRAVYPSGNSAATTANFTTSTIAPQNLENSAVTTTTATFTWEANGAATQYQWKTSKTGSEWSEPTTDLTATAEGLEPGTIYSFYVRSYYAAGIYSAQISAAFTTSCATKSIGWSENFDAADALPACWESSNFGSENNKWNIGNFYESKSAWNSARFYAYRNSSASSADLITPAFELNEPAMLKFYYLKSSANNVAQVLIRIAGEEDALLWTATTKSSWAAKPDSIDLTTYTGNTVQFIFRAYGSSDNTTRYFYLDDVSVVAIPCYKPAFAAANVTPTTVGATITCEADKWNLRYRTNGVGDWTIVSDLTAESYDITGCIPNTEYEVQVQAVCSATRKSAWTSSQTFTPSCVAPTGMAASAIKRDGATITWTGDAKNLQYKVDGAAEWTNVAIDEAEKANPYILSGLEGSTTYEVRVQAFCAVDVDEAWTDAVAFTTKCALQDAAELPLEINSFTAVPECWEINFVGEYSGIANNKIYFYGNAEQMAVLPAYDIELNKLSVTFGFSTTASLEFGYLDEPNGAFHAFASQPTSGEELNLENEAAAVKYIAVRYTSTSANASGSITSVQLRKTPNCAKPTDVAATPAVGAASITWESTATAWKLQYKLASAASWSEEINVATKPYNLTGLAQGTTYKVRVQAACAGEETSDWSDEAEFTTDCDAITSLPFIETFDAALSNCWNITDDETTTYAHSVYSGALNLPGGKAASGHLVVLPEITASLTNAVMTIEYTATTGNTATPQVGYIDGESAFQELAALEKSNIATEARVELNVPALEGHRLALRYDDGTNEGTFAIREIRILNQLTLADNENNSEVLAANNGQTLDVTIGRTIVCADYYNTLCLPFDLPTLDGTPLEGGDLWAFKYAKVDESTSELLFRIIESDHIEAGVPYFIAFPAGDPIVNPFFKNVTISATEGQKVGNEEVAQLCGIVDQPVVFNAGDQTKLFLAANNTLFWWAGDHASQLNNFRAYFKVNTGSGPSNVPIRHGMRARIIKEDKVLTGVEEVQVDNQTIKRLENDQVVIIRNGVKYSVQGQVISK